MTSGGNNLNDFPEIQLTKFRAVYTVNVNRRGPKSCRQLHFKCGVNTKTMSRSKTKDYIFRNKVPEKTGGGFSTKILPQVAPGVDFRHRCWNFAVLGGQ